ncbi:MAG: hypothetical protein Q4C80_07805 [Bacillota bacterium]|nr:hypothetical protein [Bacillota bacterium]
MHARKRKSRFILIVITLFTLILSTTIAFAGHSYGSKMKFSAGTKSYTGQSYVFTNTWAYAYQRTCCNSSEAQSGWLGNKARLYYSSGTLKGSSSWNYNSSKKSKGSYLLNTWGYDSPKNSSFYSKGESKGWNTKSSSYTTKPTPKSPNQTSD